MDDVPTRDIILFLFVLSLVIIFDSLATQEVIAESPHFGPQELVDALSDIVNTDPCINSAKCSPAKEGNQSIDIITVNYYSNGNQLNCTLWLSSIIQQVSFGDSDIPAYGMFIDADSNVKTGWQGIDYQLEIAWNKTEWTKVLYQLSTAGANRTLRNEAINHNEYAEQGNYYVLLSLDLTMIGSPSSYKLMFYAEDRNNDESRWKTDFTSWIDIPKPTLELTTTPDPIELRPGDNETFGVQIVSNNEVIPQVYNFTIPPENQTTLNVKYITDKSERFNREPYSFAVQVPENAQSGKYIVSLLAYMTRNSTIPILQDKEYLNLGYSLEPVNLPITVLRSLSIPEQFINIWNTWSSLISFIVGLLAGKFGLWILAKVKKIGWLIKKSRTGSNSN